MAGHIPRSFIDDLLARLDIVDVIDARVKLKKKGKNYSACCPFHNEKTPSFSVSQEKQFYHCFGCGAHGNIIDFVMEYDHLEFVEAIEELASFLGLEVPREQRSYGSSAPSKTRAQKLELYDLMESISRLYKSELRKDTGVEAIKYLKQRGLSGQIVAKFGIGFVPDSWDIVKKHFSQDKELSLVEAGMLIQSDNNRSYDRFRNRIMFPIRGHKVNRGKIIGFGGRVLDDSTPKYLNSPETDIFKKGKELYGLYEALEYDNAPKYLIVVEGYMDVVALAQYDINYAVASLGTSTTGEHLETLFRQTSNVVCCYDGDRAGRDAAWRALENALSYLKSGNILKFLFLPDGEDPDSYVRKYGKADFEQQIANATPLSQYLFDNLIELHQINLGSHEGKSALRAVATPLIDKIPDPFLQEVLEKLLDERTGFDHQLRRKKARKTENRPAPHKAIKRTPMRDVIALLIQNPSYAELVPDLASVRHLMLPGLDTFSEVLEKCRQYPHITTGQLLEHWRDSKNETLLSRLASWEIPLVEDNQEELFLDSLDKILAQCVEKQIENLQAKERSVGLSTEEKRELQDLILKGLKA
ncbi:DNA primase [Vibrio cholerae]|uniref:DNA primase n=1 Tax=Vibrio cholerae TaxID=666 RepID=UPI001159BACA|nr:DNA primase [Vibrio cholerae]EHP5030572.1 DNA primase [Vibrio cholerae]EJX7571895.1 DNA primase [Vibrio cholerae]TQP64845.1 DNA primase [Vibrio cholerae]TQP97601.1 DNA primase [Vibrio cholerae]TQQ17811.1 DNA primase [Vibrio cholerae]